MQDSLRATLPAAVSLMSQRLHVCKSGVLYIMNMIYIYTIVCTDHCLSIYLSYIISFVIYPTITPSYHLLTLKLTNLRNMSLLRSCCISCITCRSLAVADSRLTNQSVASIIYCAVGGGMSQYFAKNRLLGQSRFLPARGGPISTDIPLTSVIIPYAVVSLSNPIKSTSTIGGSAMWPPVKHKQHVHLQNDWQSVGTNRVCLHSHHAIFYWYFQEYSVKILHAIIDRVCLGIPKWCIVGYSLPCPIESCALLVIKNTTSYTVFQLQSQRGELSRPHPYLFNHIRTTFLQDFKLRDKILTIK